MSTKEAIRNFSCPAQKLSTLNLKSSDYALDKVLPLFRMLADIDCGGHLYMSENDKAAGVESDLLADGLVEMCAPNKFGEMSPVITPEGRKVLALRERERMLVN